VKLPRFLREAFDGFEVIDLKEWLTTKGFIEIELKPKEDRVFHCHRCGEPLGCERGKYPVKLEAMPLMGIKVFVKFMRTKGYCVRCKKARAEAIEFIAPESPHLTCDYAYWLGKLCEISAVSRAAELTRQKAITLWRHDYARMQRYLEHYKIPAVTAICVDEVYARRKPHPGDESRDDKFFTIISDLKTRKVIWVSKSRSRKALDEFFNIIGKDCATKIEVVAIDQHDPYVASITEHAPQATIVFDRFHLVQNFEEALNETRKDLFEEHKKSDPTIARLAAGRNRFIFLEKDSRRTDHEKSLIKEVANKNKKFLYLELIKERFLEFFNHNSFEGALRVLREIGDWIWQQQLRPLMLWYQRFERALPTIENYFKYKVTTALAEAINNVIKSVKRRAFGYRNMDYFRLKIMQVCGYLNSRFISLEDSRTYTNM
jgi:transposase